MLLCAGGSLASAIIVGYITSMISAKFSSNIRKKIYNQVESFGMEEIKKFSTSSLITRTTNDIINVQMLLSMGLQLLIKAPITAIWAIFKILNKGWEWSLITGIAVFILLFMVVLLMILVIPKFKKVQKLIDKINNTTREQLTGIYNKNADLILVLDSGDCIGKGTHKELLKTCKVYQEIAYSQISKEELDNE